MRFETRKDRQEQYRVSEYIGDRWNCELFETSYEDALPYDYVALRGNKMAALVEIKCRGCDKELVEKHGVLMEHERLNNLYRAGKTESVGSIVVWKTSDNWVYYCAVGDMAAAIQLGHEEISKAPPHFMKDDHGKQLADKRGWLVKAPLLKRAGRME